MSQPKRSKRSKQVVAADDLIEKVKRFARPITHEEMAEANLRRYEQLGLDINDVERMAKAVHLELDDLLLMSANVSITPQPRRVIGKPGRKSTTKHIADFAAQRRAAGKTWMQILSDWRQHRPDDTVVKGVQTIREAYRRYYGDKAHKRNCKI